MADLSNCFLQFSKIITPTKTEIRYLRKARRTITERLKLCFQASQLPVIRFEGQGSFSMNTIIRSVSNPFDIDIGVYLMGMGNDPGTWPKPEAVSQWLIKALETHTTYKPMNKRKCVRIKYSVQNTIAYYVDLPVYIEFINFWGEKRTRIGITGDDQWSKLSYPTGFTKWFIEQCQINRDDKQQLCRLVQYAKAWKDMKGDALKFPSGMALTVLLAKNYYPHKREDVAFTETIRNAYNWMDGLFWLTDIENPVLPYDNLMAKFTTSQKQAFHQCLGSFVDDAKQAIRTDDPAKAVHLLKAHLGQGFPA